VALLNGQPVSRISVWPPEIELGPPESPSQAPTATNSPSTSTSATPTDPPPQQADIGAGSIALLPDAPGACSTSATVNVNVDRLPDEGYKLWIVAVLLRDSPKNNQDGYIYPKERVPAATGTHSRQYSANRELGIRHGLYLLVAADESADLGLERLLLAPESEGDPIGLPEGVLVVAESGVNRQDCR
jgi:hypothetical protein